MVKRSHLFESATNGVLLDKMQEVHSGIALMESRSLERSKILRTLLEENPNLSDYDFLLRKVPWGARLRNALLQEKYEQDEKGELWNDFVMGRIHRALGGKFTRFPRFDGRFSFEIQTGLDIIYFNPESSACLNDGPVIHIWGNKIDNRKPNGFDTDRRFGLIL